MLQTTDKTIYMMIKVIFIIIDAFKVLFSIGKNGIYKDQRKILQKKTNNSLRQMLQGYKGVRYMKKAQLIDLILVNG